MRIIPKVDVLNVGWNNDIRKLIHSPHMLVRATSERRIPARVATSGSQWLK
jgi:hypothetical protein